MRTQHAAHAIPFPAFCCSFVSPDKFLIAGGGGASRTGVKNTIRLYQVKSVEEVQLLDELILSSNEDAPMAMAYNQSSQEFICGINSSAENFKLGQNENCRSFRIFSDKLKFSRAVKTFPSAAEDDYIRVATYSKHHNILALASTSNQLSILQSPDLTIRDTFSTTIGDLYDLDFNPDTMVATGTNGLSVYTMSKPAINGQAKPKSKKKKTKARSNSTNSTVQQLSINLLENVQKPTLAGTSSDDVITYRAARFHPEHPGTLYAVLITSPSRKSKTKAERKTFIVRYETVTWKPVKIKRLNEKGSITCLDISSDGRFIAFGTSSCAIGVLDAKSLAPVFTILRTHEFPPTTLRFNPEGSLLISGSADNTLRLIQVPQAGTGPAWITLILMILAVLIVVMAFGWQRARSG